MKKTILTLSIITLSILTKAQTQKGTVFLGGAAAFSNTSTKSGIYEIEQTQLSLAPVVGWFVSDNWSVGISPMYEYNKSRTPSVYYDLYNTPIVYGNSKQSLLGAGVNVRYYWMILPQFGFSPQVQVSYLTSIGDSNAFKSNVMAADLSPNFVFFPTKKIGVHLGYGAVTYAHEKDKAKDGTFSSTTNSFNLSANHGISLGVNFYLAK
jgi:hypothetical protein